jgi:hypothetical protein
MAAFLLLGLLVGYFVVLGGFLAATTGAPRRARVLGIIAILLGGPAFFWFGLFSEQFTAGQCYSSAIGSIANSVAATRDPAALAVQIRELPLRGYETSCTEVEEAARRLPNAVAP